MDRETEWQQLHSTWQKDRPACTLNLARAFLAGYPDSSNALVILGSAFRALSRYSEARRALLKAIRLASPEHRGFALANMGHIYYTRGFYSIAERWYRKAVAAKPMDMTTYLVFLGDCLERQGKFTEAKRYHRRAIKLTTSSLKNAYYALGVILRAEEKYDDALECFEKAKAIDSTDQFTELAIQDLIGQRAAEKRGQPWSGHSSGFA